jgi:DNA-binding NarL/FixJ family response regulator
MVVLENDSPNGDRSGVVAVVLGDRVNSVAVVQLRKLVISMNKRVVLVTDELSESQVEMVLDAGVQSVVWRHQATPDRLIKAVETASRGEGDVPSDLLTCLLAQLRDVHRRTGAALLPAAEPTQREIGVLKLVADGLDTKEIAGRLSCSERTVKGLLHDVMVRRQLRNRAHAVAFVVREGYI